MVLRLTPGAQVSIPHPPESEESKADTFMNVWQENVPDASSSKEKKLPNSITTQPHFSFQEEIEMPECRGAPAHWPWRSCLAGVLGLVGFPL